MFVFVPFDSNVWYYSCSAPIHFFFTESESLQYHARGWCCFDCCAPVFICVCFFFCNWLKWKLLVYCLFCMVFLCREQQPIHWILRIKSVGFSKENNLKSYCLLICDDDTNDGAWKLSPFALNLKYTLAKWRLQANKCCLQFVCVKSKVAAVFNTSHHTFFCIKIL